MAPFGISRKKPKEDNKPLRSKELQAIKEKVVNPKIQQTQPTPPSKPKKTDFVATSDNLNDIGSTEMKLIKILNEIENVKKRIDEAAEKTGKKVENVDADIASLVDIVRGVPKETLVELRNIKKNQPTVYQGLRDSVTRHVSEIVIGAIDSNILKIIKQAGRINSTDLLAKVEEGRVCSKNTLYAHLSKLEDAGYLTRKREVHEVYYSITDKVTLPKEVEAAPGPKAEPVKEAPKEGGTPPKAEEAQKPAPQEQQPAAPEGTPPAQPAEEAKNEPPAAETTAPAQTEAPQEDPAAQPEEPTAQPAEPAKEESTEKKKKPVEATS